MSKSGSGQETTQRRLWRSLRARFAPPPIDSIEGLETFLEERAALIAQKCAIDYCRGKTGLASYALFTEAPFLKALDVCRWETFAAVLGDLIIITEGNLRQTASPSQRAQLRDRLATLYATVLGRMPAPEHRPQGWADAVASFAKRMEKTGSAAAALTRDVADHSAKRLFDTLPIHSSMRALDEEVVYGAVRFRMTAVSQEMQRRLIAAKLVEQLIGAS